ncbi:hypothetical protein LJR034_001336 [Caballeronia sp. LjRoot34]
MLVYTLYCVEMTVPFSGVWNGRAGWCRRYSAVFPDPECCGGEA